VTLKLLPPSGPPGGGTSTPPAQITGAMTVTGSPRPGNVLHAHPPTWTPKPSKLTYQWQLCTTTVCRPISGANTPSLKITRAYVGKSVRMQVTATIGTERHKTSSRKIQIRK
jgi:hypothetical protein